jgi:hypothetical protein
MAVRHLIFHFTPFNILIADMYVSTQTGDEAVAGREETIQIKTFPPDNNNERTIWFKGYYLAIYNEQTGDYKTHITNNPVTTTYESYTVPAGYSVHVRAATVKFEV